ncbi:MAG: hypothetical protein IT366_24630 [Candidatus Hydrogenedentes bacterium]|nr:hypothetical protein [Candidatus Hydrogenedentota bacterium]
MGKGNAATQIALGLATGALHGFAQAKKEKKAEEREDSRFELYKKMHELQIENAQVQGKILDQEYERAKAMGAVFTPEQEAEYKKNRMALEARSAEAEAKLKEFDVENMDEDRSQKRRYMDAQIGAMERSGRGGGSGGGGGDDGYGMDIKAQRALAAMDKRMDVFKSAHFNEDTGEWDSSESVTKFQSMANDYERLLNKFVDFGGDGDGTPGAGAGGEHPMSASLAERMKKAGLSRESEAAGVPKPKFGMPSPFQSTYDKPLAERGGMENLNAQVGGFAEGLGNMLKGLTRFTPATVNNSEFETAEGQPFDVYRMTPEQIQDALAKGAIRKRAVPQTPGYMVGVAP